MVLCKQKFLFGVNPHSQVNPRRRRRRRSPPPEMSFAASSASADAPFGQIRVRAKPDSEEVSEAQILKTVLYYVVLLLIMPLVCFGVSKVFVLSFVLGWDINAVRVLGRNLDPSETLERSYIFFFRHEPTLCQLLSLSLLFTWRSWLTLSELTSAKSPKRR